MAKAIVKVVLALVILSALALAGYEGLKLLALGLVTLVAMCL